jgi:hypothetical protein
MAVSSATMAFGRRTSYNGVWDRKNITKKWPILIASSFTMLFKENSTAELDMQSEKWRLLIAKTLKKRMTNSDTFLVHRFIQQLIQDDHRTLLEHFYDKISSLIHQI